MILPQCEVFTPFVASIADRPRVSDNLIDARSPFGAERPKQGHYYQKEKKHHVKALPREAKPSANSKLRKVQVLKNGILHGQGGFGIIFVVARVSRIQEKDKTGEKMSIKKAICAGFLLICGILNADFITINVNGSKNLAPVGYWGEISSVSLASTTNSVDFSLSLVQFWSINGHSVTNPIPIITGTASSSVTNIVLGIPITVKSSDLWLCPGTDSTNGTSLATVFIKR